MLEQIAAPASQAQVTHLSRTTQRFGYNDPL
jgi:hypothetical protein